MKTLRVVDDGEHDERVEEREESAWSELERSGTIWNAIRALYTPRASLRGMRLH